jgi:hypothetical protein
MEKKKVEDLQICRFAEEKQSCKINNFFSFFRPRGSAKMRP